MECPPSGIVLLMATDHGRTSVGIALLQLFTGDAGFRRQDLVRRGAAGYELEVVFDVGDERVFRLIEQYQESEGVARRMHCDGETVDGADVTASLADLSDLDPAAFRMCHAALSATHPILDVSPDQRFSMLAPIADLRVWERAIAHLGTVTIPEVEQAVASIDAEIAAVRSDDLPEVLEDREQLRQERDRLMRDCDLLTADVADSENEVRSLTERLSTAERGLEAFRVREREIEEALAAQAIRDRIAADLDAAIAAVPAAARSAQFEERCAMVDASLAEARRREASLLPGVQAIEAEAEACPACLRAFNDETEATVLERITKIRGDVKIWERRAELVASGRAAIQRCSDLDAELDRHPEPSIPALDRDAMSVLAEKVATMSARREEFAQRLEVGRQELEAITADRDAILRKVASAEEADRADSVRSRTMEAGESIRQRAECRLEVLRVAMAGVFPGIRNARAATLADRLSEAVSTVPVSPTLRARFEYRPRGAGELAILVADHEGRQVPLATLSAVERRRLASGIVLALWRSAVDRDRGASVLFLDDAAECMSPEWIRPVLPSRCVVVVVSHAKPGEHSSSGYDAVWTITGA